MSSEIKPRIVYVLTRTNKADDDETDVYVGSTSLSLRKRLWIHRGDVKRSDSKLYERMREVGINSWEIIPLLQRTCDKKTIWELERKWIKIMGADLNTYLPILTPDERKQYRVDYYTDYRESNKEKIKKQKADYYMSNKEAIRKQKADYYESNKERVLQQKANYRELNKEAIRQRQADYYESNKERVLQQKADYYESNKQDKRYCCDICEIVCGSNKDLQKHFIQ